MTIITNAGARISTGDRDGAENRGVVVSHTMKTLESSVTISLLWNWRIQQVCYAAAISTFRSS